jgi:hypothetical protein
MGAAMAQDRQKKLDKMRSAAADDPTELTRKVRYVQHATVVHVCV